MASSTATTAAPRMSSTAPKVNSPSVSITTLPSISIMEATSLTTSVTAFFSASETFTAHSTLPSPPLQPSSAIIRVPHNLKSPPPGPSQTDPHAPSSIPHSLNTPPPDTSWHSPPPATTTSSRICPTTNVTSTGRQPLTSTREQQSKGKNKIKNKNTPPTDIHAFQLECKIAELNTANAKIQQQESKINQLTNTNNILGQRIKLFEDANKKEIFEKYFPSKNTVDSSPKVTSNRCNQTHHAPIHCCSPHPCHVVRCCSSNSPAPVSDSHGNNLESKIDLLFSEIKAMKTKLDNINNYQENQDFQLNIHDDPPRSPTTPPPDVHHASQDLSSNCLDPNNSSIITIDENVPSSPACLNSHVPTTQLPQLKQPTNISQL